MNHLHQKDERGPLLHRWRITLGWDAPAVAALLGVSVRTIGLWETAVQPMPDARWRLFIHEIVSEVTRVQQLVVVFAEDRTTVIDVVSDINYAGMVIHDDGRTALIASHVIDRHTGQPRLHRQIFPTDPNKHVIAAAQRWDLERSEGHRDEDPRDRAAAQMYRWLQRRILEGELNRPELIELKKSIADARTAVDLAVGESEEIRMKLNQALDLAVAALVQELSSGTRKSEAE
jgi:hypothetical protein